MFSNCAVTMVAASITPSSPGLDPAVARLERALAIGAGRQIGEAGLGAMGGEDPVLPGPSKNSPATLPTE